jgi:tRNA nucleotidyltransferase/poly(A) polymerase
MLNKIILQENVPDHIISVVQTIENNGFQAYIVGGALRDLLLGRIPIEYDLASNAAPHDIKNMFEKTTTVGEKFGTICIHIKKKVIEITTFRKESNYTNARHPDFIEFANTIEDDLNRRDFTMNAMAYHPLTNTIVDPFNGMGDIQQRQIKCVGDPILRFKEDTLRPFRCFRFMSQLGFVVDQNVVHALKKTSPSPLPSRPRIRHEMDRLILGKYWLSSLKLMASTAWLKKIIPNSPSIESKELPDELLYRWAWLLSNTDASESGKKWQFSNRCIRQMKLIQEWNYDEKAINLSIHHIQISSNELMSLGYKGKALGEIQKKLLELIRKKNLDNDPTSIQNYLKKQTIYSE